MTRQGVTARDGAPKQFHTLVKEKFCDLVYSLAALMAYARLSQPFCFYSVTPPDIFISFFAAVKELRNP